MKIYLSILLALCVFLFGCRETSRTEVHIQQEQAALRILLDVPPHFTLPPIPDYNIPTAEKIDLGRHLFYDKRLSGNGTQSCAGCHLQLLAFADGLRTPRGSTGTTRHLLGQMTVLLSLSNNCRYRFDPIVPLN